MTASFVNEDDRRETIAEPGQVTCRPSSGLVPILCAHRCRNQAIRLTENCPSEGAARNVVVRKYERAARRRQGSLRLLDLPRRLKPIPKRSGYRSAEALRHPKSAASEICWPAKSGRNRIFPHIAKNYFAVTSECVMAWTESAMRFCTPTLRISLVTCAFTVRSFMPRAEPISLLERPATSISRTSFSRSVKVIRPAGKIRPGDALTRSMKVERTRRGAHTEP